jgi:hypothetical protein
MVRGLETRGPIRFWPKTKGGILMTANRKDLPSGRYDGGVDRRRLLALPRRSGPIHWFHPWVLLSRIIFPNPAVSVYKSSLVIRQPCLFHSIRIFLTDRGERRADLQRGVERTGPATSIATRQDLELGLVDTLRSSAGIAWIEAGKRLGCFRLGGRFSHATVGTSS